MGVFKRAIRLDLEKGVAMLVLSFMVVSAYYSSRYGCCKFGVEVWLSGIWLYWVLICYCIVAMRVWAFLLCVSGQLKVLLRKLSMWMTSMLGAYGVSDSLMRCKLSLFQW